MLRLFCACGRNTSTSPTRERTRSQCPEFATLSMAEPSQFYKLEEFKLYKRRPLQFPEYVGVSNNYFDKRWSGARRVKNVVMVLDWTWDASDTGMHSHSLEPLSEDQERTLATAIEL